MADRTVYGRDFSENGWRMVDQGSCVWVKVPGTDGRVSLQIREGQPAKILGAFVADWNAYIEPVRDADSACWTPTNDVSSSNHLSGTACDVCWQSHPFRVKDAGFNAAQIATMREMLAFYEQIVWWGNDWVSPRDAMHVQMNGNTYGANNVARVQDFINRKIRADGFSTFRRGGTVAPPVVVAPPVAAGLIADTLSRAMGGSVSIDRYQALLPAVRAALVQSGCAGNLNRTAMWLAQVGHESGGLKYMEEIASGAAYEGRSDLGNTQPGDGVRFKGHGPIQITGRANHASVSKWAFSKGYVPTATYFVDNPQALASDQYGFLGVVWYWTVARSNINAMCDAGDLNGVTRAINGGLNGLDDRRTRWDRCRSMGLAALDVTGTTPLPQGDDELSAAAEQMIREMRDEIRALRDEYGKEKRGPSRSFLATDGAGVESPLGFLYNMDGNIWTLELTWAYLFDVPLAIDVVTSVARNGAYEGSWVKSNDFNAWLNEFGQAYCTGLINFKAALVGKLTSKTQTVARVATENQAPPVTNVTNVVDTRALEDRIAGLTQQFERLQAAVSNPPVTYQPVSAEVAVQEDSTGDKIQRAVDSSMDYTDHVLTLDAAKRTALTRALNSIDPSNGAQA